MPAVPRNMTNYTRSELRINQAFCRAYSGRLLRFNAVLKPAQYSIAWVKVRSPIMELVFDEVHKKLHCGLGPLQNNQHFKHTDAQTNMNITDNIKPKHKRCKKTTNQHTHKRQKHKATFKSR